MPIKIDTLFPTFIAQGALPMATSLNQHLLREIRRLAARDRVGREWSRENYRGGYTSYASLSDLPHRAPVFARFADLLEPHAMAFARTLGWQMRGLRLEMSACWMNVMPSNTYHPLHLHPQSVLSGTYYVRTPPGSVALKLEDPRMPLYMNAPPGKTPHYHLITPRAGRFVLFESWLRHEVPPNQGKEPRVSLSFNYSLENVD